MATHVVKLAHSGPFLRVMPAVEHTAVTPGAGGDAVQRLLDEVVHRWEEAQRMATVPDINDIVYHPVPANRTHRFRVKLRMRGAGAPLPFPPDEAEA